jgi:hypothetical protein
LLLLLLRLLSFGLTIFWSLNKTQVINTSRGGEAFNRFIWIHI